MRRALLVGVLMLAFALPLFFFLAPAVVVVNPWVSCAEEPFTAHVSLSYHLFGFGEVFAYGSFAWLWSRPTFPSGLVCV